MAVPPPVAAKVAATLGKALLSIAVTEVSNRALEKLADDRGMRAAS